MAMVNVLSSACDSCHTQWTVLPMLIDACRSGHARTRTNLRIQNSSLGQQYVMHSGAKRRGALIDPSDCNKWSNDNRRKSSNPQLNTPSHDLSSSLPDYAAPKLRELATRPTSLSIRERSALISSDAAQADEPRNRSPETVPAPKIQLEGMLYIADKHKLVTIVIHESPPLCPHPRPIAKRVGMKGDQPSIDAQT